MAIAPEQVQRIGIRRHFTTPDVHPYDTVEWETREARIPDLKSGGDAFYQPDVEFPATWSQNATNIVAQKYFRGPLGAPEREYSVRQIVDRVADTITDWGVRDGYFADDEEAETFRAELKHVLVHQRASFNSPVWFNIGVPGEPAQASACQPYDALISTPDGLIPIGKLAEENAVGTKVYDAHGVTRVVATKHNGVKPVLRIHTKAGYTLDVTPDHLVWRARDERYGSWVRADEVRSGDKLEWHRVEQWGGGDFRVGSIREAALAGWLQSDGFVGQYDGTNRSLTIEAMTVTPSERHWVLEAIDAVFPDVHRHERLVETQDDGLDCRRNRLYGQGLADFIDRWGLAARGVDMKVPDQLLTAPLSVLAAYLRSIFQAEGYVSVRERGASIGMDMVSEDLVRGIQRLLARFAIYSRVRRKNDPRSNRLGTWSLQIRALPDRIRFATEIGFIDSAKAEKLDRTLDMPGIAERGTKRLEVERVEALGEMDVYDIQTESGEYLSGGNLRVHNCFILDVDDTMDSILNWYREEGIIFKGGSGSGVNLSKIRSSKEQLKGGGTASGPVSFMRGADASAGTIKSAGKTRRAAKMAILNVDHPDVEEFIWCKALEERKARALREAGFDMDLDGTDSHSIQYQNANNSVRVTDEFMKAVEDDADWDLTAVTTGELVKTVKARELMRELAEAAWECADPGMQYDTTINRWNTAANTGRINASNPCFTGDAYVHTDKGLIRFAELVARAQQGEAFGIYTHDATNPDEPAERVEITRPEAFMVTGWNEIVRLRFSNGAEVRCTPNHRFWTVNRGYVRADELTSIDEIKVLNLPAPAAVADLAIPTEATLMALAARGDKKSIGFRLPEKWTPDLAHYVGWLVGDGCISGDVVSTVYGTREEQEQVLPSHRSLIGWMNDDREPTPSAQANGTVQLRQSRRALRRFFEGLGVKAKKAGDKVVPRTVEQAPPEIQAAFLRGLFDADGCVYDGANSRYVGLGSASVELLRGVQRLLTSFGIFSRIYHIKQAGDRTFRYTRKDGTEVTYESGELFDLRIANRSIVRYAEEIGFEVPSKSQKLDRLVSGHEFYKTNETVRLKERADDGVELTFNLTEARNHSYIVNGQIVANCSEYMHLDNSACNLASINVLKFLNDDDSFDVEGFKHAVEVVFSAQEILVGNADYPTERIGETARAFRELGLGYANLGALLMARGLPYDSDEGRTWSASITALMTGHAYATSARTAARMGPFAGYAENREPMLRVLDQHRKECAEIDEEVVAPDLLDAARQSWDEACELGDQYGVRNSQATVIAPTGTISFLMDCDTTGVEPDLALTKHKKLVGGGTMEIVNRTVPRALRNLGYDDGQVDEIVAYVDEHKTIVGAPHLSVEHLPVFATAMGDNVIHYMGHVNMLAAVQPFLSGSVSKTINMPENVQVDDVEDLYMKSWKLGLKSVAIYRDNCKVGQPLSTQKKEVRVVVDSPERVEAVAEAVAAVQPERIVETVIIQEPVRQRLQKTRNSKTFSFRVADCKGYCTVGEFEDGRPGEIFLKVAKQGSTLAGIMDSFAIGVSLGLQYGVPLRAFVEKYTSTRFEPAGMTDDKEIRFASSLVDYIFRRLAVQYMPLEERAELAIFTVSERTQPTLPGVEEAVTPTHRADFRHPELDFEPAADDDDNDLGAAPVDEAPRTPAADRPAPARLVIDAPICTSCGAQMRPSGSCYVCPGCGSTSGCS